jgi:hypothetical protein
LSHIFSWRSLTGVDLTEIDWFDVQIAQTVLSEVGTDMEP